jgi:hypothetical protein
LAALRAEPRAGWGAGSGAGATSSEAISGAPASVCMPVKTTNSMLLTAGFSTAQSDRMRSA